MTLLVRVRTVAGLVGALAVASMLSPASCLADSGAGQGAPSDRVDGVYFCYANKRVLIDPDGLVLVDATFVVPSKVATTDPGC